MKASVPAGSESVFSTLRWYARPAVEIELCEFCGASLLFAHRHLLETATRKMICACDPCALRFENVLGLWKLIPRDSRSLTEFKMSDEVWDVLSLPIRLAFFYRSTSLNRVIALYPSPAGATESRLPLESWEALVTANPCLARMEPDVEALLVNRLRATGEYYLAPIDLCFGLVGLIRWAKEVMGREHDRITVRQLKEIRKRPRRRASSQFPVPHPQQVRPQDSALVPRPFLPGDPPRCVHSRCRGAPARQHSFLTH